MNTIVGLGEVLWDVFPDQQRLGGAPANVAFHAERLGEICVVVSRVGDDALGRQLVADLGATGLETDWIQIDTSLPTGTVNVSFDGDEPRFEITSDVAWDNLHWDHKTALLATSCDAAAFSTLSQRSKQTRESVQTFLQSMKPGAWRALDVNFRPPFVDKEVIDESIGFANVVKYNRDEREQLAAMFGVSDIEDWLLNDRGVELCVLTRGSEGCALYTSDANVEEAGVEVDTSGGDAVGVGDAFLACVLHELLRKAPLHRIASMSNRYAAIVAKRRGGMPGL